MSFDFNTLSTRFRETAFLNAGLHISLTDERTGKKVDFQYTKVPLKEYLKTQHGKRDEDKEGSNE